MTTAVEVAEIGLKRIMVQGADAPLSADEYADFYRAMNNFMATLSARGVKLGYTNVSAAADVVTVPDGAIEAIAANVAVRVASDYGMPVSQSLAVEAREGRSTLSLLGVNIGQVSIDSELPYGSGNYISTQLPKTFGKSARAKITMTDNALVTTPGIIGKANGFWDVVAAEGLSADITGRVTNTLDSDVVVTCKVTLTAFATGTISNAALIAFVKNSNSSGTVSYYKTVSLSSSRSSHTYQDSLTLKPGEYVELWLGDGLTGYSITVTEAVMEVS